MDKEMMDKANEILKASGKRELCLDEMDKVSGGSPFGEKADEISGKLNAFMKKMVEKYGTNNGAELIDMMSYEEKFYMNWLSDEWFEATKFLH